GEGSAVAGALEHDFAVGFGGANPLCAATRCDEDLFATDFHQVDGGTIELAAFTAADFEEIDEAGGEAEAGGGAERAVEHGFERAWRLIFGSGVGGGHQRNRTCFSGLSRRSRVNKMESGWRTLPARAIAVAGIDRTGITFCITTMFERFTEKARRVV